MFKESDGDDIVIIKSMNISYNLTTSVAGGIVKLVDYFRVQKLFLDNNSIDYATFDAIMFDVVVNNAKKTKVILKKSRALYPV